MHHVLTSASAPPPPEADLRTLPACGLPPSLRGLWAPARATLAASLPRSDELERRIALTLVNGPAMGHDDDSDDPAWQDTLPMQGRSADRVDSGQVPPPASIEPAAPAAAPGRPRIGWAGLVALLGVVCAVLTAWASQWAPWGWGVSP